YRGLSLDAAKAMLDEAGVKYEICGGGASVVDQVPVSNSEISVKNGKVILYTEAPTQSDSVSVPNVIGKSAEEANIALINAGLNVSIDGRTAPGATVFSQSVRGGDVAMRGTVIEIKMRFQSDTE
ncbi:MAG: PASTA domain-containing protein, partial [Clostridiales bacterium]|nr:PASTA domain-containing protein [Clostridiales bacterium]